MPETPALNSSLSASSVRASLSRTSSRSEEGAHDAMSDFAEPSAAYSAHFASTLLISSFSKNCEFILVIFISEIYVQYKYGA